MIDSKLDSQFAEEKWRWFYFMATVYLPCPYLRALLVFGVEELCTIVLAKCNLLLFFLLFFLEHIFHLMPFLLFAGKARLFFGM